MKVVLLVTILLVSTPFTTPVLVAEAAPNLEINYQGKLTDENGATVADADYDMEFKLYTVPSGGSPLWTETLTGSDQVTVTNGLFSVMLGSTTALTGVDFNQTLYLGVKIGTDSEMTPRKVLGTVPAAFVAEDANDSALLGGVASTSFLRSDQADTASGLLTFTGGLVSNSSSTIISLSSTNATTTNLYVNSAVTLANITNGVLVTDGNGDVSASSTLGDDYIADTLTIGSGSTFASDIITPNAIHASGQGDELCLTYESTGSTWEWQDCAVGIGADSLDWDDITDSMTLDATTTIAMGNYPLNFDSGLLYVDGQNDRLGIGTSVPAYKLTIDAGDIALDRNQKIRFVSETTGNTSATVGSSATNELIFTTNGTAEQMRILSTGYVGIGTSTPSTTLHVWGDLTLGNSGELYSFGSATLGNRNYTEENYVNTGETFTASIDALDQQVADIIGGASGLWQESGALTYLSTVGNEVSIGTSTASSAKLSIQSDSTNDILNLFETGGNEVFTVLENGDIGIGNSAPAVGLDIYNGSAVAPATSGTASNAAFRIGQAGSAIVADFGSISGKGVYLQSTVSSNLASNQRLFLNPNGGSITIGTTSSAVAAKLNIQSESTNDIMNLFETGGQEVFTVLENGRVGIGTDTPGAELDVVGSINLTGDILSTGSPFRIRSNTDIEMHLDDDNNSISTFTIKDGANASVFQINESGQVTTGEWTGTDITVSAGGTGVSTLPAGELLVGAGTSAVTSTTTAGLKSTLALDNVENTALSSWGGSSNITTVGTVTSGTWNSAIQDGIITEADLNLNAAVDGYVLTASSSVAGGFAWEAIPSGVTDHGALTGLTDDDHTQYALLAGRSGGQTLIGGTGTTDDLTFQTTSGVGATGADMHFLVGNNGATEAMTILNSGNVGIGTTIPSTKLDVVGTASSSDLVVANTVTLQGITSGLLEVDDSGNVSASSSISATYIEDAFVLNSGDTMTGTLILPNSGLQVGSSNPFSDSAGDLTLQNIDVLDATTETTIEGAIDTLGNLTSASSLATVGTITSGTWNSAIQDGIIVEADLDIANSASDELCLTYESDTSNFQWQSCASGSLTTADIDTSSELAGIVTDETGTGPLVFASSSELTTPTIYGATLNGTLSFDATGENNIEALIFDADAETITGNWVNTANPWADDEVTDALTISGGTVNNTVIGGTTAAAITGTTITANTGIVPDANDGAYLGTTALGFSDLYLASGGTLHFANTDWVATHSAGVLTVGTGDLRVTTAGTNAASVVTVGGTQTLTNKTWNGIAIDETYGGTGLTSYSTGDLIYASGANTLANRTIGSTGDVLWVNGGVPQWTATSSLGFASAASTHDPVTLAGSLDYITLSGQQLTRNAIDLTTDTTGTLAVGSGGTGITTFGTGIATWLGTPSSANLASAITDELGTGKLVFASSSALTAPTLYGTITLDATAETSIENAIDTLANLTSWGGFTWAPADAGTDAVLGWDDTAGQYENLTASEVLAIVGGAANDFDANGDVTITEADISDFAISTGDITDSTIIEADLNLNAPSDGYVLAASSSAAGGFAWYATSSPYLNLSTGGAEVNNLETIATGIADTEIFIGTGVDTGNYAAISGDATMTNTGALTLASSITSVTSLANLTTVGTLNSGGISSGFGAIDIGTSNFTTGGQYIIDVDGTAYNAAGALTLGAGTDAGIYFNGTDLMIETQGAGASGIVLDAEDDTVSILYSGAAGADFATDGLNLVTGDTYQINNTAVLSATTLGSGVVNSSLTGVGTLSSGTLALDSLSYTGTLDDTYINSSLTLETISGTPVITNGVRIGTDDTDHLIDEASNGAGSATLYIGNESILASGDIGGSVQAQGAVLDDLNILGASTADGEFLVATGAGTLAWESGATARTSLGVDAAGTDNSTDVTLAGTPDYITISGQVITRNKLDITDDTNATGGVGIDITANDFTLDLNELTTETSIATGDYISMVDVTDNGSGKITYANFVGGNWTGTLDNIEGASFLRSDATDSYTSGTLTFDAATTLDLNTTNLLIADTDVAFDGASTNFAVTGDWSMNTDDLFVQKSNGYVGIGTTTPESLLHLENTGLTGNVNAGIKQDIGLTNSTLDAVQYGDRSYLTIGSTATSTVVGGIIRVEDTTTLGNVVRGFEVQANKGGNTQGENTALSGFARTFGVRGYTSADAGGVYEPAAGFFELAGSGSQGNAIRAYSSVITSSELLSLYQEDTAFTGTGLLMNFGNDTGGSFNASTSKFVDLQNSGTSKFTVTAHGTTTIGDGTTSNLAGLQIGYGGLCVDTDGSCDASVAGRIAYVSSYSGNSDLAEMYFSRQDLEPGELVVADGFINITRATGDNGTVLGVVSTKPGVLLGSDDTPLSPGEGYPLALSGRVPVKLSTENGPINVGDPLTLSSLPGIAMKATEADTIVGYALEAFTGTRAYTDGYINQFGDDIAEPNYEAFNVNTKANNTNTCHFGGGGEAGEDATADCDPTEVTQQEDDRTAEEIAQARYEAEQAALAALRTVRATTHKLNGTNVKVGTITMFVDRGYHITELQTDILNELTSTSTDLVLGAKKDSNETLWDRLKVLAQNFVDGVLAVAGIKADKVETNELCVDDVCVTGDELRALLDGSQTTGATKATGTSAPTDNNSASNDDSSSVDESSSDETTTETEATDEVTNGTASDTETDPTDESASDDGAGSNTGTESTPEEDGSEVVEVTEATPETTDSETAETSETILTNEESSDETESATEPTAEEVAAEEPQESEAAVEEEVVEEPEPISEEPTPTETTVDENI